MKVELEAEKCIAAGQCVMLAPEVFDQDDAGIAELRTHTPAAADHEAVRDSVALCPAAAIKVSEE